MAMVNIPGALKLTALGCAFLTGAHLFKARLTSTKRPALYTLMDIAYLASCTATFASFAAEGYYCVGAKVWWPSSTPENNFDIFLMFAFCIAIAILGAVFVSLRLKGGRVLGTICCIHGIIFTTVMSDFLEVTREEYSDKICYNEARIYSEKKAQILVCCAYITFGSFLTSGLAYRPVYSKNAEHKQRYDLDGCSPFSRVFVAIALRHLKNTIIKARLLPDDFPKQTPRFRCSRNMEGLCLEFINKVAHLQHLSESWTCRKGLTSPCRFYCLLLRHGWKELFWSNALTLLYYASLLLRIPVFYVTEASSRLEFFQSVLLLSASCIAEILVSSMHSYYMLQNQARSRNLLQSAVFKKVTHLSAAAITTNSAAHVSSLLSADSWLVAMSMHYLPNIIMGLACVPIALAVLTLKIGYLPACACLAWLVAVGAALFSMEPLLDKYCNVFYKYRDERLKKFTDFLHVVRLVKMSALEDVFQDRINQLRLKEINQAYHVNILDGLLETLISSSASVMIILAFVAVTFMNPHDISSPPTIFSCVYTLTLMDVFTNTVAHAARLKSPVFRSCRRLMSFFEEEEWMPNVAENRMMSAVPVGEVTMKNCSFAWSSKDRDIDRPVLTGVDLHLHSSSIVGIVGPVGSGKSVLLSSILGDTKCLGGSLTFKGRIAVVCQRPHVFNMTIRDNITFGRKYDESYYKEVLEACQMARDIERFPAGDLAEAGEKGEMLSGGQRQRVALARAIYSRSDIYLLDDPTSSQDARVTRAILEHVIGPQGLLGEKTRILVTSSTRMPFKIDNWVLMNDNRAILFRDLNELKKHPGASSDILEESKTTVELQNTENSRQNELNSAPENEVAPVFKEERIASSMGAHRIFAAYIKYSGMSTVLALLCFAASASFVSGQIVCIKVWASLRTRKSENMQRGSRDIISWLAIACVGDVVFRLLGGVLLARGTRQCSLTLHAKMLSRVAESPLSFFDATPRGRLLNRFSEDLEVNDSRVFVAYKQLFQSLLCVVGRLAVIGTQSPTVFVLAFGAEVALVIAMRYVIRGSMIGRLYESTRMSRVLQQLAETLDSVGVIRCYGVMEHFSSRFRRLLNDYIEAFNLFALCYSFSRLIVTMGGVLVITLTTIIVVVPNQGHSASAAAIGLSLLCSFSVPFAMAGVFMSMSWATQGYVALERALEYTELPVEEKRVVSKNLSLEIEPHWLNLRLFMAPFDDFWPSRGAVKFDHFSASYRPGVVGDALKDICFEAQAGEKVAVVGRTGAGKSSLVLALLRMIQRTSGAITIDGTDTYDVPLKRLRSAIGIIPQAPSLFCGTLRENLDPPSKRSDAELWSVLRSVGLEDFVDNGAGGLSFGISEKGENLSVGQQQLVSLARALLRGTKILVLDEATSFMDPDTDRRIQAALRKSFSHCTLITIAHRIETILDYDRVVVMGDGRVLECGSIPDLLSDPRSTFRCMVIGAGLLVE